MKTSKVSQGGFTLFEIIVVIGVLTFIMSAGLMTNTKFIKNDLLNTELSLIIASLEKTRSLSMNNMFQTPHGFCYIEPNYIIFRDGLGTKCVNGATTNILIPANTNIANNPITKFPQYIIFSQLAGTTTVENIKLSDAERTLDININSEGTIEW